MLLGRSSWSRPGKKQLDSLPARHSWALNPSPNISVHMGESPLAKHRGPQRFWELALGCAGKKNSSVGSTLGRKKILVWGIFWSSAYFPSPRIIFTQL
uniref:Uncharacterized protein n=1 Tax=Zosterops lateralis melanops TaxID=1220523 RepID=A0A8D2Q1S6_ZOSLA